MTLLNTQCAASVVAWSKVLVRCILMEVFSRLPSRLGSQEGSIPRFLTPSPLFVQIVTTLYYVILLKHSITLLGQRRVQINERFLFLEGSV